MNNLPNRLTVLRMLMVPLVMFFILNNMLDKNISTLLAAALFILASVTDWFDGKIARKYNLITNFGKIMDPLADKLIVFAVILCLVNLDVFPVWCAMIILARDFLVTGMRVIAAADGVSVAASIWGKVKTTVQMIAMVIAILFGQSEITALYITAQTAIYAATFATVISGISYVIDYKKIFEK